MELVSFVTENAVTGVFGGMGIATLSVFAPRLISRRFSSKSAIPVEMRVRVQEQLNDYESLLRKAEGKYELLKTNLALAYPNTPFSSLKIEGPLEVFRETHKSDMVYAVKTLLGSNMKTKEQDAAIAKVLNSLESRIARVNEALNKINSKQDVLDAQISAREKMSNELASMKRTIDTVKEELPVLQEKYDPLWLMTIPENIYQLEEDLQKATVFFEEDKDKFFNSSSDINNANKAYETAVASHKSFMDKMNSLTNFQREAIKGTQPLKKVLMLKEPVTPADLRKRDTAMEAVFKAQTHVYDSGHPQKVMMEILRPVYEYLES